MFQIVFLHAMIVVFILFEHLNTSSVTRTKGIINALTLYTKLHKTVALSTSISTSFEINVLKEQYLN